MATLSRNYGIIFKDTFQQPQYLQRYVFCRLEQFTFLADFVIVDYESDPHVPLILGRPFLWTTRALIDVHGEEMILRDGNERLFIEYEGTYSFATNHPSGNPTSSFTSHTDLTSLEVNDDIFDPEDTLLRSCINLDKTKDLPSIHVTPLREKIKDSKILIDELDPPRSSDFLPSPECDLVFYEDFSEVDALSSTNNEDKVFNPGILIHENLFEVTNCATPEKNVKKPTNASLILEDFNPLLWNVPFHKEVPGLGALLSFSSENEEKVFNPGIITSKRVHTSLLSELSHRGPKAFKVIKILESPLEIFPCSYGEDIRVLDVPVLALENSKTAQDLVIQQLKKRVKRLEKALRERTPGMKLFKIVTLMCLMMQWKNVKGGSTAKQITTARDTLNIASINVSTVGPLNVSTAGPSNVSTPGPLNVSDVGPSTSTVGDIFKDEMTTIVDYIVALKCMSKDNIIHDS
ncbi:hypothetical protein Tco_1517753 [Tanacetum coccineum]